MNAIYNQVQLAGHLGADAEVRRFENSAMVRLRLAVHGRKKDSEGNFMPDTTWFNVVSWGLSSADFAEKYLQKGTKVMVRGKLVNQAYQDKEGKTRKVIQIHANQYVVKYQEETKISKE